MDGVDAGRAEDNDGVNVSLLNTLKDAGAIIMRVMRCDRCGAEASWGASPLCRWPSEALGGWRQLLDYDICPACAEAFEREFMGKAPAPECVMKLEEFDESSMDTVPVLMGESATAPEYDHEDVAAETQTPEVTI